MILNMRSVGHLAGPLRVVAEAGAAPLASAVAAEVVLASGADGLLRRLVSPPWLQAAGAFLVGGESDARVTVRVLGALRRGLEGGAASVGVAVHLGPPRFDAPAVRGLSAACERVGRAPGPVVRLAARAARIDDAAMLDGYALSLQAVVVTADGGWAVIDQGRSDVTGRPRRYHWIGRREPTVAGGAHAAIACDVRRPVVDLVCPASEAMRAAILELAKMTPAVFEATARDAAWSRGSAGVGIASPSVTAFRDRFGRFAFRSFDDVLLADGIGPREVEVLVGLAELLFGVSPSTEDPATHGFAAGRSVRGAGLDDGERALLEARDELLRAAAAAAVPARVASEAVDRLEAFVERARRSVAVDDDPSTGRRDQQLTLDFA
jgi:hypothetical protein